MKLDHVKLFARELADKWQIPIFMVAVLLGTVTFFVLFARHKQTGTEECLGIVEKLIAKKDYTNAGKLVNELLKDTDLPADQQTRIHGLAATLIHQVEEPLARHDRARLENFHYHFNRSAKSRPLTMDEHLMLADVYQWEGRYAAAVDHLRAVLNSKSVNRVGLLKRVLDLLPRTGKEFREEYAQRVEALLAEKNLSDEDLVWALDAKTEILFGQRKFEEAVTLLQKALPRLKDPRSRLGIEYSLALGRYEQDRSDRVEPEVRDLLNRLTSRDELEAKVLLLLGQICTGDDRPEEANSFYDQLIEGHPLTDYHMAALVGKAQASARLNRLVDSQRKYEEAFSLLDQLGPNKHMTRDGILKSISATAGELAKKGDLDQALVFAHLQHRYTDPNDDLAQHELLGRIATWHKQRGVQLEKQVSLVSLPDLARRLRQAIREHYQTAGDYYLRLSRSPGLLDRTSSQVLWESCLCYEKAGQTAQAQQVLEAFIKNWPFNSFLPEALYKLARMYQGSGRLIQAEACYRRLATEYSRITPWGPQGTVGLAECYFAMGPRYYLQAEKILRGMVDDTSNQRLIRPESAEFRQAMFLLGKLYYYKTDYEPCVGRLEEALERYPTDRSGPEARFLIAQSYRKIAEQTGAKIAQTNDKQLKETLLRSQEATLRRAGELYQLAIAAFEGMNSRSKQEETYLGLAYIFSADCLYDLHRYDQAIKSYEKVIDRYEKTPLSLDCYVQIINCYQRQGQWGKIKAVLERMKWLLKQMPEDALPPDPRRFSRRDWERWIDWNYRSGLVDNPEYLAQGNRSMMGE